MLPDFDNIPTGFDSAAAHRLRDVHRYIIANGSEEKPVLSRHIEVDLAVPGTIVRACVSFLREKGYGVCSSSKGYWIAKTPEEAERTVSHLEARIHAMQKAVSGLRAYITKTQVDERGQYILPF